MKRRDFLRGSAALAGTAYLGGFPNWASADTPLKYYMVNAFSGTFSANGKFGELGAQLAIKHKTDGIGRPIEFARIDTEGNAAAAVRKIQNAINDEQAQFFTGTALSSTTLAIMKDIERGGGLLMTYVGADEVTGAECSRSTFRWSLPTYGAIHGVLPPLIAENPGWKRWYTITPQYVFGESLLANAQAVLADHGLEHAGNSFHSLQEKEYSGYLVNALSSDADVLLLLNFGANSIDSLRQAVNFGIKNKMAIVVPWSSGLDNFMALGSDVVDGVYFGTQYWHTVDSPANREFVELVRREFGTAPRYYTAQDYQCAVLMFDGMRKAGSTDPAAVIQALEGYAYEGLTGSETVRALDHQVDKAYLLLKGKSKDKMQNEDDFADLIASNSGLMIPADRSQCTFEG